MHKFSIIIPIYNVEKYIKRCIQSVCAQTFLNFEIIIVNDGTQDNSMQILQKELLEKEVDYKIINQKNKGLGGARNTGIVNATGEFLLFLDSDDYLHKELLYKLNQFVRDNICDIILFDSTIVDEKQKLLGDIKYQYDDKLDLKEQKRQLLMSSHAAWNKAYKRTLFIENNIRYPEKLLYEDLATTGKTLIAAKRIGYIKEKLYYYVKREDSITSTLNFSRFNEIIPAFEMLKQYYVEQGVYSSLQEEFEYIAISNFLLSQVTYINHYNYKDNLQQILTDYILCSYPQCAKNAYVKRLSVKERRMLGLIFHKRFAELHYFYTNCPTSNLVRKILKK